MEMDKIPALGYRIVGLPILGLQRRFTWKNFTVPFRVLRSISKARRTIRDFGADAVVGFGGYASAPVLWAAQRAGVPTVIQEQNSFAGLTNKIPRTPRAPHMRRLRRHGGVLPAGEDHDDGQPAARSLLGLGDRPRRGSRPLRTKPREARGAGGGRLARNAHAERDDEELDTLARRQAAPVQVIWQTGKYYEKEMREFLAAHPAEGIWQGAFIERMDFAYAAADAVISRSGACTVSELCLVAKPTIFVPRPTWRRTTRPKTPWRWSTRMPR